MPDTMDGDDNSTGDCKNGHVLCSQINSQSTQDEHLIGTVTAPDVAVKSKCEQHIYKNEKDLNESAHKNSSSCDGVSSQVVQNGNLTNRPENTQTAKTMSATVQIFVFLLSFVVGVMSVVLVMSSSGNSPQPSSLHISSLLESLEKHGYSSQIHPDHIQSGAYGSPDLLTADHKQELLHRLTQRNVQIRDVDDEEDALAKANEPTFMTIDVSGLKKKRQDGEEQYVVVFDAGSTGSRVHIYRFRFEGDGVQLMKEVYRWTKPGLSDFVQKPHEISSNLQPLIDVAMATVPADLHSSTPLVFKATAGLRLLDAGGAEMLLQKVRELLASTNFDFDPQDINIMGGTDEGLFGWITINYLLGNLDGSSLTAAALDLGGGSVQITYKPLHTAHFGEDLGLLELFGEGYDLYTHSYLGQGLKAARNGTLKEVGDGTLSSSCLPVGYIGIFTYEGIDYKVRGPEAPSQNECWRQVGEFLSTSGVAVPWDFVGNHHHPDVYLFSYFYEVLEWAGVIHGEAEKIITVDDIYHAAYQACHAELPHPDHPFLCQDLTYITRLLAETFMLWDKPLHVIEEIQSGEVSWSLGAALDALSRLHSEE